MQYFGSQHHNNHGNHEYICYQSYVQDTVFNTLMTCSGYSFQLSMSIPRSKLLPHRLLRQTRGPPVCTTTSVFPDIFDIFISLGINPELQASFDNVWTQSDGITITLGTPFICVPTGTPSSDDSAFWAYVPQTLIEWVAQNPDYLAQYPALSSCYPGGPSIGTSTFALETETIGGALRVNFPKPYLTVSTTSVVNSLQCFRPVFVRSPLQCRICGLRQLQTLQLQEHREQLKGALLLCCSLQALLRA
jgi:hypothetical protein